MRSRNDPRLEDSWRTETGAWSAHAGLTTKSTAEATNAEISRHIFIRTSSAERCGDSHQGSRGRADTRQDIDQDDLAIQVWNVKPLAGEGRRKAPSCLRRHRGGGSARRATPRGSGPRGPGPRAPPPPTGIPPPP